MPFTTIEIERGSLGQPESDDVLLWRYMDLARFMSLLEKRSLMHIRADRMSDKWEGALGELTISTRGNRDPYFDPNRDLPRIRGMWARNMVSVFMNCWHLSEYESAAMWDIYQREGRAVAVQTTLGRLKESITSPEDVVGSMVRYVNYQQTIIQEYHMLAALIHKRLSFAHEKEYRLMVVKLEDPPLNLVPVTVDLDTLIQKIYLAPDSPSWIAELLEQILTRYGLKVPVIHSDLDRDPVI